MSGVRFGSVDDPAARALNWTEMVRTGTTDLARVDGPFEVIMEHGEVVSCEDGWLAVDAAGKLYPITADVVEKSYAEVDPGPGTSVVERIAELDAEIRAKQAEGWGDPRELALALTHLEDCQMRFTRARAKATGVFRPVDLERVEARAERERFEAAAGEASA